MSNLIDEGLTYDDILLIPSISNVLPKNVSLKVKLTKNISLNSPIMSAGMESVTDSKMAIAIARQGGIGVIHCNMSIEKQAEEVDKVKRSENGVISDPFYLSPNHYVYEANALMGKYRISGVPITEGGELVGIITNRDLRFERDHTKKIYEVMTKDNLITAKEGITIEEAEKILRTNKLEKLPIVDDKYYLKGLITIKDIEKSIQYPNSARDNKNRLLVAGLITPHHNYIDRLEALINAKVDVIVLESIYVHSELVIETVKNIKNRFPNVELVVGNVATQEFTLELIKAGADAIKVGIGSASISTTRIMTGVGVPQFTAICNCSKVAKKYNIPIIADGGIKYPGDITKAIVAGANIVMIGRLLVGCEESPAKVEYHDGRKYKVYRAVASISDLQNNNEHFKDNTYDIISGGFKGLVSYKGSVSIVLNKILDGVRCGMSHLGCEDISQLQKEVNFMKVTSIGIKENYHNGVKIINEVSNNNFSL